MITLSQFKKFLYSTLGLLFTEYQIRFIIAFCLFILSYSIAGIMYKYDIFFMRSMCCKYYNNAGLISFIYSFVVSFTLSSIIYSLLK